MCIDVVQMGVCKSRNVVIGLQLSFLLLRLIRLIADSNVAGVSVVRGDAADALGEGLRVVSRTIALVVVVVEGVRHVVAGGLDRAARHLAILEAVVELDGLRVDASARAVLVFLRC